MAYTLADGRRVEVDFEQIEPNLVRIKEKFDPEKENPIEMQRQGWQAILNHVKEYVEVNSKG